MIGNAVKIGLGVSLMVSGMVGSGLAQAADGHCTAWVRQTDGQDFCSTYVEDGIEVDARDEQGGSRQSGSTSQPGQPLPDQYAVDRYAPACTANTPTGGSVLCPGALSCAEGPDYVRYWHWVLTYQRPDDVLVSTELVGAECRSSAPADDSAVVTPGMVAAEMARLPIQSTVVTVAPAPVTLVNFDTGFSTNAGPAVFSVTLLGQPVRVRVRPVSFIYEFGDGDRAGPTNDRGAPYPVATVVHRYTRAGSVAASITVTYTGEFSVAGGAWLVVPGTVSVPGTAVDLRVREARAQLVAG